MHESGMKEFTKAASSSYHGMSGPEKEELRERCGPHIQAPTAKAVKRDGNRIFKNIEKQVFPFILVQLAVTDDDLNIAFIKPCIYNVSFLDLGSYW